MQALGVAGQRLVEDRHHVSVLGDRPVQVVLVRDQRLHQAVPVGDQRPELGVVGRQRVHDLAEADQELVEVLLVGNQRVRDDLEVGGQLLQVLRLGVQVLAVTGQRVAQGVDQDHQVVADAGVQGLQHLGQLDRREGAFEWYQATVLQLLRRGAPSQLDVGLAEQVLGLDDGPGLVGHEPVLRVQRQPRLGALGGRRERVHAADAQAGDGDVVADHQLRPGREDRLHVVGRLQEELSAHLAGQEAQ